MLDLSASSGRRQRQRAYRARLAAGRILVGVEVDAAIVDFLVRLHWLREGDAGSRAKIGAAVGAMLADAARRI
jgi:hypothetical protein